MLTNHGRAFTYSDSFTEEKLTVQTSDFIISVVKAFAWNLIMGHRRKKIRKIN